MSIVRENLMNEKGYTAYCGGTKCTGMYPRTIWNKVLDQFKCPACGWTSQYPKDFIKKYREKWGK